MYNLNFTSKNSQEESNRLILDLKRRIEKEFDTTDWSELGLLVNADHIISNHPRLLRSLSWGDEDYGACIIDVLKTIRIENPQNLQKIKEYLDHRSGDKDALYVSNQVAEKRSLFLLQYSQYLKRTLKMIL